MNYLENSDQESALETIRFQLIINHYAKMRVLVAGGTVNIEMRSIGKEEQKLRQMLANLIRIN
jgi:hypothetical protein